MRLLACHIDNFGKISNLDYNFTEGVNVIHQPNGWGKSTFATFLKVMFYGFDSKKEKDALDKERKLYYPWQGGTYGGELDFEINGKSYRISRTFGKTEKVDQFHLYDLTTNLETDVYGEHLGEEIFDIDSASFKRSVYIAQNDALTTTSDAINAKLGNLAENTNDINNYDTADSRLKDLLNKMSPTRATGSMSRRRNEIMALKEEIKTFAAAEDAFHEKKKLLDNEITQKEDLKNQKNQVTNQLKAVSEAEKKAALRAQYQELCQDYQNQKKAYLAIVEKFHDVLPEKNDLDEMIENACKLENYETTIHNFEFTPEEKSIYPRLRDMFAAGIPSEQELENASDTIHKLEQLEKERMLLLLDEEEEKNWKQLSNKFESEEIEADLDMEAAVQNQIKQLTFLQEQKEQLRELENRKTLLLTMQKQKEEADSSKGSFYLKSCVPSIIIMLVGIAGFLYGILEPSMQLIGITCGALFFVIGLILFLAWKKNSSRKQKQNDQKPIDEVELQIADLKEQMDSSQKEIQQFLQKMGYFCEPSKMAEALYECKGQYHMYLQLKGKKEKANDKQKASLILSYQNALHEFLERYYEDISERAYLDALHDLEVDSNRFMELQKKRTSLEEAKQKSTQIQNDVDDYLKEIGFEPEKPLSKQFATLASNLVEYNSQKSTYEQAKSKKKNFEQKYPIEELQDNEEITYSIEECNAQIHMLEQKMEDCNEAIKTYSIQLEELQNQMDQRDEKEEELSIQNEVQEQEKIKYEQIKLAQSFLQSAKEQFTAKYMAPVSEGFGKYFHMLTETETDSWMVDTNMNLKMKDSGEYREAKWFSAGYQDLIGVCMRLALVDAMYTQEKPFLVFDDPFVNLDNDKVSHGNRMLEKLGEEYQTIYFTCHKSRVPSQT